MMQRPWMIRRFSTCVAMLTLQMTVLATADDLAAEPKLQIEKGDHVAYIGNTLADRMQHHAWLETYIQALFPEHNLTFRNLGYSVDEVKRRDRADNFGSPDQWLTKVQADNVFCFFGRNEALSGDAGLEGFKQDLAEMLDGMREQKYNGKSAPQIVVFSPIAQVCQNFFSTTDSTRYRARLELSGRDRDEITREVGGFAESLNPKNASADRDEAQALLECLWVFEEQRLQNVDLVGKVFQADEGQIRAAAIRTLGHWGEINPEVSGWQELLQAASRDESAFVRAEALKAAVVFEGSASAEVIFEVATRPTDPELDTVLKYAKSKINADALVRDAIASGKPLSKAAMAYSLLNASVTDLLKLERSEAVYEAILSRQNVPASAMRDSLNGLAEIQKVKPLSLALNLIESRDAAGQVTGIDGLLQLLVEQPAADLKKSRDRIENLALKGKEAETRQLGYAALIQTDGAGNGALFTASKSKDSLRDLLAAVPSIADATLRGSLYSNVRSLMFDLPPNLEAEQDGGGLTQAGVKAEYFYPSGSNVAIETLAKMTSQVNEVRPTIDFWVPKGKSADKFALQFTGSIAIPKTGKYQFFIASDDGSRLYLDGKLVINNDGLHGMSEKNATVTLTAGSHDVVVTYFDNGGGDGLKVAWSGPGFKKQPIAADRLSVGGGTENLHDVAIRSLASIPGHEAEKFSDLSKLIRTGRNRTSAINGLRAIPEEHWPDKGLSGLIDNIVGYLSAMPARLRTGGAALDAIALTRSLSKKLPVAAAKSIEDRLQNLGVRVIAIGTVVERMIYDKEKIVVQAGKPVEFRFTNSDNMEHNFVIVQPGALAEVGEAAERTGRDPDAKARHYVPVSDKILLSSNSLDKGKSPHRPVSQSRTDRDRQGFDRRTREVSGFDYAEGTSQQADGRRDS